MADEADNVVLRLLREIRSTQQEHSTMLQDHSAQLKELRKQIGDWQETTATVAGFAVHGNLRQDATDKRVEELAKRVERLEEKL